MSITTSAGSTISIGTTATNGAADTYTLIGEVINVPQFGAKYETGTHKPVGERVVQKFKGALDGGDTTIDLGNDFEDAGQDAVRAALAVDAAYNFRVELNDAVTVGGHGTYIYFKALVTSDIINVGGVSDYVKAQFMLAITTQQTYAAAT